MVYIQQDITKTQQSKIRQTQVISTAHGQKKGHFEVVNITDKKQNGDNCLGTVCCKPTGDGHVQSQFTCIQNNLMPVRNQLIQVKTTMKSKIKYLKWISTVKC